VARPTPPSLCHQALVHASRAGTTIRSETAPRPQRTAGHPAQRRHSRHRGPHRKRSSPTPTDSGRAPLATAIQHRSETGYARIPGLSSSRWATSATSQEEKAAGGRGRSLEVAAPSRCEKSRLSKPRPLRPTKPRSTALGSAQTLSAQSDPAPRRRRADGERSSANVVPVRSGAREDRPACCEHQRRD